MSRIAHNLYQLSSYGIKSLPQTKDDPVVFWMCGGPPPAPFGTIVVDFPVADSPKGLKPEVFENLVRLTKAFSDCLVITVCQMGENRSGLASVLTLIARGEDVEEAIKTVQENGPHNSSDKPHSFWNEGFVNQVREYFESEPEWTACTPYCDHPPQHGAMRHCDNCSHIT